MATKKAKQKEKNTSSRWPRSTTSSLSGCWFTDILGILKSFAITVEELEGALEEGMGFDGSSIEGFARIDESDMVAMPDPDTWQLLPWNPPGAPRHGPHVLPTSSCRAARLSKATPGTC